MTANELTIKANEFKDLSEFINVKIVGEWIWIDGGTKQIKDKLKEMGCKYAAKKKKWCWYEGSDTAPKWGRRKTKKFEELEEKYGSREV